MCTERGQCDDTDYHRHNHQHQHYQPREASKADTRLLRLAFASEEIEGIFGSVALEAVGGGQAPQAPLQ